MAQAMLESAGSNVSEDTYAEVLQLVRRSSCNCHAFEFAASDSMETKVCPRQYTLGQHPGEVEALLRASLWHAIAQIGHSFHA
jgi:hypothetical protein